MKKLILIPLFILAGCSAETEEVAEQEKTTVAEPATNVSENELSPSAAKKFATELLQKINSDEEAIRAAYQQKDVALLDKYNIDLATYINPNPNDMFDTYWIDSKVLDPYVKCDTALRDLYVYTGVLSVQLRKDTKSLREIVSNEEQDYMNSKTQCAERVAMSYEEAKQADEQAS